MTTTDWTTPLLTAIDAAAAEPGYGYQRFDDIIDELPAKLLAAYRQQWAPADAALQIWPAVGESAT